MQEHDDEMVVEPEESEDRAEKKVAKQRDALAQCRAEKQEYMDGWQRAKADYVNLLKRFDSEKATLLENGKVKAVETLLPAFDALERAREHGEVPDGFTAIAKQIESGFTALGLTAFGKVGESFDPSKHDALGTDKAESAAHDNTISVVLEKGWCVGESIIRPAKVRVAQAAQ